LRTPLTEIGWWAIHPPSSRRKDMSPIQPLRAERSPHPPTGYPQSADTRRQPVTCRRRRHWHEGRRFPPIAGGPRGLAVPQPAGGVAPFGMPIARVTFGPVYPPGYRRPACGRRSSPPGRAGGRCLAILPRRSPQFCGHRFAGTCRHGRHCLLGRRSVPTARRPARSPVHSPQAAGGRCP
jgi:hypothetical protein